jgi:hypothetical protein
VFSSRTLKILGTVFILLGPFLTITENLNKDLPIIENTSELLFWSVFVVIGVLSIALGVRKTESYKNKIHRNQINAFMKEGSIKFTISLSVAIFIVVTCSFFSFAAFYAASTHSEMGKIFFLILVGMLCGVLSIYITYILVMRVPLLMVDNDGVHLYKLESRIRGQTFIPWNLIRDIKFHNKPLFVPYFPYFVTLGLIAFYLNHSNIRESIPKWFKKKQVVNFNIGMLNLEPEVIYTIISTASNNQRNTDSGADAPPPVR